MLAGFFGVLAIVLAVVGLYGVISYMAARRTNEIGIRIALGADRGDILGMIMKDAAAMCGVGIVAGIGLAAALGPAARALLFGMKPTDPATLLTASLGIAAIAAVASAVPAIRAARLNPVAALHEE
jgi:ABC-type antimicrobial peptide transport system permease subunit